MQSPCQSRISLNNKENENLVRRNCSGRRGRPRKFCAPKQSTPVRARQFRAGNEAALLCTTCSGIFAFMSTAALTGPLAVPLDSDLLFQSLVERLQFSNAAEEWSRCTNILNRWEEEHLLVDNPVPEKLAQHKKIVERLMFFGQLCAFISSHPEFNDSDTAGMVFATQQVLRDKLRMFHNPMTQEEAD